MAKFNAREAMLALRADKVAARYVNEKTLRRLAKFYR
jgi:hypothetical protein